jgi:hypothetical protein
MPEVLVIIQYLNVMRLIACLLLSLRIYTSFNHEYLNVRDT